MNENLSQLQKRALQLACHEILHPTWGTTEQFFEVHQPVLINGIPSVARIDTERDSSSIYVYFYINDQKYFWVLRLDTAGDDLEITGSWHEPAVNVHLHVVTDRYSVEEITEMIGLEPTSTVRIGQIEEGRKVAAKENSWDFEPNEGIPDELERKLVALLEHLLPCKQAINELARESYCVIHVVSYDYAGYGSLNGIHFDAMILKSVSSLGVEMDFDMYAWGPELRS